MSDSADRVREMGAAASRIPTAAFASGFGRMLTAAEEAREASERLAAALAVPEALIYSRLPNHWSAYLYGLDRRRARRADRAFARAHARQHPIPAKAAHRRRYSRGSH